MAAAALPSQEELQRRLRAARVLCDLTFQELAALIPAEAGMGERVLRRLEGGESVLRPPALRELCEALGLDYAWWTVPSIPDAVSAAARHTDLPPAGSFDERLAAVERWIAETGGGNGESSAQPPAKRRGPRGTRPARER